MTLASQAIPHGAIQKEAELQQLLDLVCAELAPGSAILEIGCDAGGTLYAWRRVTDCVVGVDLPSGRALASHGAQVIVADSHDPRTLELVRDALGGREVGFLFIDGDHSYAGVRQDWEMYAPLVRPGGLVAFHDICHHEDQDVGVERLWQEIGQGGQEFVHPPLTWGGIGVLRT